MYKLIPAIAPGVYGLMYPWIVAWPSPYRPPGYPKPLDWNEFTCESTLSWI